MTHVSPGEVEVFGSYSMHLGPRYEAAGLRVQFLYNQTPGIHFKTEAPDEYRDSIMKGLRDGMALRFPKFPAIGSVWITEVAAHEVDSSQRAFYRAARMVVDQAFAIASQYATNAEPSAAPNGGPATQLGNSRVTEGPPSVS
jgi:translation elongation factor EF-G